MSLNLLPLSGLQAIAGEKKRKAELKVPASGAEDSYDDDEDEESEEEVVEVCDQTVEGGRKACTACGGRTRQARVNCRPEG